MVLLYWGRAVQNTFEWSSTYELEKPRFRMVVCIVLAFEINILFSQYEDPAYRRSSSLKGRSYNSQPVIMAKFRIGPLTLRTFFLEPL